MMFSDEIQRLFLVCFFFFLPWFTFINNLDFVIILKILAPILTIFPLLANTFVLLLASTVSCKIACPRVSRSVASATLYADSITRKKRTKGKTARMSSQYFLKKNLALRALWARKIKSITKIVITKASAILTANSMLWFSTWINNSNMIMPNRSTKANGISLLL